MTEENMFDVLSNVHSTEWPATVSDRFKVIKEIEGLLVVWDASTGRLIKFDKYETVH